MRLIPLVVALCVPALAADDPQRVRLVVERQDAQTGSSQPTSQPTTQPTSQPSAWRSVNAATVFAATDRLRFRVSANFAGYLYVMNQGTSGSYEQLFPRADTGADNRIEVGKEYVVPAAQGFFKPTGPPGQDIVYFLVSPTEISRQYKPLPPPPPKSEIPANLKPRCDDVVFKARGECIDNSAGVRPVKSGEKMPANLSGVAGATPRELLFMQEKGGTIVSSAKPLSGPVVYELRLAHN